MTELHITRSRDIGLYIGDEQLFGVTDFLARSKSDGYPIREYLRGEPHAVVNSQVSYELRLTTLSLFRYAALEEDGFTLRVEDDDTVSSYLGCTVTGHERSVQAGKNVVDIYTIKAKEMTRQVQENAG